METASMADVFTVTKRSEVMSRIRSSGTKAENTLYALVRECVGSKWRIDRNVTTLPGKPDIVVPGLRIVIFADGCFYHDCPIHGRRPTSNAHYWTPKLRGNVQRDRRNRRKLRLLGYSVWQVWEHALEGTNVLKTHRLLHGRFERALRSRHAKF